MKFLRYIVYSFLVLILIFVPVYGASRILLPDWLKGQISAALPSGAKLSIGKMSTTASMGVLYEKVIFETNNTNQQLIFDDLLIQPNLSLSQPAIVSVRNGSYKNNSVALSIEDFEAKLIFKGAKKSPLSLLGKIKSIENNESELFSNIEFLLGGLTSREKSLSSSIGKANLDLLTPNGLVSVSLEGLSVKSNLDKKLEGELNANKLGVDLSKLGNGNPNQILFGGNSSFVFELKKVNRWILPIQFKSLDVKTPVGNLARSVNLSANGIWESKSQKCEILELLSGSLECGKMVDVTNLALNLKNLDSELQFLGEGFCVTPEAGCPQRIDSEIRTRQTTEILSNVIMSVFLNPIIGGVILGSLLSSPVTDGSDFDHQTNIQVCLVHKFY